LTSGFCSRAPPICFDGDRVRAARRKSTRNFPEREPVTRFPHRAKFPATIERSDAAMKKKLAKPAAKSANNAGAAAPRTLAIDIGGTGIKALTLDRTGKPLNERTRIPTPKHAKPKDVIEIIRELAEMQDGFERASIGFPGVVKDGVIYSAANLGKGWTGFDLRAAVEHKLKKPVRIANDADIQGLGCMTGHGLELVVTLGTGFGSVLFAEGVRVHMELGHHPFHKGKTYEDELGNRALKKQGRKKWNKLLKEAIADLRRTFNFDALYIGGGNSHLADFKLPAGVKTISNEQGLLGGIALWSEPAGRAARAAAAKSRTVKAPSKPVAPIAPRPAVPVSAKSAKSAAPTATQPASATAAKTAPADSTPAGSSAPASARPANGVS
jgi:polyphosphate glucokinase